MENNYILPRILGLFTAEELKALGKEINIKGMSKLTKGDLIKAIIIQTPEEVIPRLVNGEGKKKVQETVKNAVSLLGGASIATERLGSIKIQGEEVVAKFDGMRWTTQCSANISRAGAPDFDHTCSCKAAETGAMCVHFWVVLLQLLAEGKVSIAAIGPFADLTGDIIESSLKNVKSRITRPAQDSGGSSSKSFDQMLKDWTIDGRYERALDELDRGGVPNPDKPTKPEKFAKAVKIAKPATSKAAPQEDDGGTEKPKRKAKKPPATPYHVEVRFTKKETGPPAKIIATLYKVTTEGKERLPFHIFIDEGAQVVAHDGCMDFDMRLRRKQLLCKHLLQVFLSIDEHVARRLLGKLSNFDFINIIPSQKDAPLSLPESIQKIRPDVRVADNDTLKAAIMEYLFTNEGTPDKLGVDAIKDDVGEGVVVLLPIMVAEGMIVEFSPGYFKPK